MKKDHHYTIGSKTIILESDKIMIKDDWDPQELKAPFSIKYSLMPIEFDMFSIGSRFRIDLKNHSDAPIHIGFKCFFGIGLNRRLKIFNQLLDHIWVNYIEHQIRSSLHMLENNRSLRLGNFELSSTHLHNMTNNKMFTIDELEVKRKLDHLELNSNCDSAKYTRVRYDQEWDWPIIESLINELKRQ